MSAVISDASIFQALLRCLRAPPPSSEDTKGPAARRIGKANLGHNRKRSLSVSEDKTKSPMPAGKNYVGASSDKVTMPVSVVAATIFYVGLQHLDHWPAPLVHAYAEDAFGQRLWVDREECKPLVENLALVLEKHASPDNKEGLVVPFYAELMARSSPESNGSTPNSPKATPQQVMRSLSEGGATGAEIPFPDDDSDSGEEEIVEVSTGTVLSQASSNKSKQSNGDDSSSSGDEEVVTSSNPVPSLPAVPSAPQKPPVNRYPAMPSKIDLTRIRPRYFGVNQNAAFGAIEKAMEERLEVKSKQNSRLLQSLPAFCVVPGVRKLAAQNLAKWLQSPALSGGARTLFTSIVNQLQNIDPPLPEDLGAVDAILEMQLKANQLNMHIENVTRIAKRIPTASISRHMFLKLLRIELSGMDDSNQSTEHMQMISTVNTALDSSSLSNDGIAAALLTLLASPNKKLTRPERDSLVRKLRMLLRRIASNLGNSFDGCGLLESLLSFDVDAASWTARDEEDRGRMLVECVSLLVPKPTNQADVPVGRGKNARKQFVPKLENGFTVDEIKALSVKLRRARKLLISWACSDYSPLWQSENSNKTSFSGNSRKGKQEEPIGAGAPNFTSVLDNNSMLKDKSSCPDAVKCALFMIDPESDTMREFLFPEGVPENMDLSKSDELFRIKQCHRYGTDLDDEMLKIIVGSAQEDGIGMHSALSLMEHLFECCKKGRKASLYLTDASIVWEMYKLVEYTPEHIPEPPPDEKEEVDEDDQFADADDDQFADADEMEIDQPQTNGSTNKENGSKTEVPRLAHPGMWWRVTTLALVMSGASPGGIGATLCENHPTVQALVKMVTSGRYRFPTVDCDDTSREQMKKGENALRDEVSYVSPSRTFFNVFGLGLMSATGIKDSRTPVHSAIAQRKEKER